MSVLGGRQGRRNVVVFAHVVQAQIENEGVLVPEGHPCPTITHTWLGCCLRACAVCGVCALGRQGKKGKTDSTADGARNTVLF